MKNMARQFDVLIIGAGVVGCAVAREMARHRLRIGVLEKEMDVAYGSSGRNSGVLHGGFTYKTGSLKAQCCVEGNQEFGRVAKELDVPFRRSGKVVVGFNEKDMASLRRFQARGEANGVRGLEIVDRKKLRELDPSAGGEFAMYSPNSGILDPMAYTIALAENARLNGVDFFFDQRVTGIERTDGVYAVKTERDVFRTRWVVNCAGLYSGAVSAMLGIGGYVIRGFKGEYIVLDKKAGAFINMPVYPAPNEKGGFATHAVPTVDGNVLIGPDSYMTDDFEDYGVTQEHIDGLIRDGEKMFSHVKREYFIRNFSGIRAKRVDPETGEVLDFVCEARDEAPHTINLVGIESPGLTSALPLARRAVSLMAEREELEPNPDFDPARKAVRRFHGSAPAEQEKLIAEDPDYGEIICRCENVTKAEILAAIHNPLGTCTVASVKNRTRATMGRCQGGYCETRIVRMIEEEKKKKVTEILYSRKNSYLFTGKVRG
ncbi:FAD/NAD(P)-binding oxidoreductase [Ruminococcaceae bacterium BL-6]|nr:FAD/NAD(P)-binding oxidoreductase [Ruminococcaceae bacterium BL-6]